MDFIREPEASYSTDLKVSTVFHGDAEVLLKKLPTDFFRCCVTSRSYRDSVACSVCPATDRMVSPERHYLGEAQLYARECKRQTDASPRIYLSLLEVAEILLRCRKRL